jgi:hypothetical protein
MAEAGTTEPAPSFGIDDARACVGARLEDVGGGRVGRVEGLLVDGENGDPTWIVVKLGRIGRRSAVPARFAAAAPGRAWAAFPRAWIRGAAEIDPSDGLTASEERQLLAHYGIPLEDGRGAALAEVAPSKATSVPGS